MELKVFLKNKKMETVKIKRIVLEEMMLSIVLDLIDDEDIKTFNEIYTVYKSGINQFGVINTKLYFEQLLLPIFIQKSNYLINQIKDNNIKQIFIENIQREVGQNQIRNKEQQKKKEEEEMGISVNPWNNELKETFSHHSKLSSLSESLINKDNRRSKNKRKLKKILKKIIFFITVFLLLCYCITGIIYLLNKETLSCLAFLFPFFN